MSATRMTSHRRAVHDHFEPDEAADPRIQRQLRGQLEQIDYTAYDANRKVLGATLSGVDVQKFQRLALATAQCRARWVAAALAATEGAAVPSADQIDKLALLRCAYEELAEVYDALRRMVERGYVIYPAA